MKQSNKSGGIIIRDHLRDMVEQQAKYCDPLYEAVRRETNTFN